MARWEDDEDWVGEPPEGRHTRDRANPDYWRGINPPAIAGSGLVLALIVLALVLLL